MSSNTNSIYNFTLLYHFTYSLSFKCNQSNHRLRCLNYMPIGVALNRLSLVGKRSALLHFWASLRGSWLLGWLIGALLASRLSCAAFSNLQSLSLQSPNSHTRVSVAWMSVSENLQMWAWNEDLWSNPCLRASNRTPSSYFGSSDNVRVNLFIYDCNDLVELWIIVHKSPMVLPDWMWTK